MRPKRKVLLVCPNETTASVLRFQMTTWGHNVEEVHAYNEALPLVEKQGYDLVLFVTLQNHITWPDLARVANRVEEIQRGRCDAVMIHDAQARFPKDLTPFVRRISLMVDGCLKYDVTRLREQMRIVMVRKRGPRKPVVRNAEVAA